MNVRHVDSVASGLPDSTSGLPGYIAIEGPIGVGKTTLARRFADSFGYPLLLEPSTENPFLDRFYREGRRHALPTQLFFLLHRAQQIEQVRDDLLGSVLVTDFLMEKDRMFAELNLDRNELELYDRIHRSLDLRPPAPDLVVYLQAPVSVLLRRIRRRGIGFEQQMDPNYLTALCAAYTEFFHYYDRAPLLIVNAANVDFGNDQHFDSLVERLSDMEGTRQYFNPDPTLL